MTDQSRNSPCACRSGKKFKLCCGRTTDFPTSNDVPKQVALASTRVIDGPAIVLLMPSRGRPTIETLKCIAATDNIPTIVIESSRKGVIEARNLLVEGAIAEVKNERFHPTKGWYALWVDDDAFWQPGSFRELYNALQLDGVDIVCAYFGARAPQSPPKAFRSDGSWPDPPNNVAEGGMFEVERCGFHFVMHPMSVFEKVGKDPFIPQEGVAGEDIAFCHRAREAGLRIWCHTGVPIWHVDDDGSGSEETGLAYLPGQLPYRIIGGGAVQVGVIRKYGDLDASLDERRRQARAAIVLKH